MTNSQVVELESSMLEIPIVKKILLRLERDLPKTLLYHSVDHTKNVIHEVILFGIQDGLGERELHLLVVAAAFHDSGFLVKSILNEKIGADFAAMAMESSGDYTPQEIALVSQMIRDTEMLQESTGPCFRPSSWLSAYLLDADVSNFGREDFFEKSQLIAAESAKQLTDIQAGLMDLLKNHKWHSPAATALRDSQKCRNVEELARNLLSIGSPNPIKS